MNNNDDDDAGDKWFPLIGDLNPMTMPFGGFRMSNEMIRAGISQTKAATEWVMDQGQDALPTFPVQAIALKVFKPQPAGLFVNIYQMFGSVKQPLRVIAYIPELHAHIPQWKSEKLAGLEEEERLKHNERILAMISDGGGAFVISPDTEGYKDIDVTSGDFLLVDYKDRKNFSGGRILQTLDRNTANFLPPEWAQPGTTPAGTPGATATSADPKKAFKNGNSSPLIDVLPDSVLDVPPIEFNNEKLDPNIPPDYRPFLHPLNGFMAGSIHSPTYIRNDRSGIHGGIDIGTLGAPIYAMADGYVANQYRGLVPSGKMEKKYTNHRYGKNLTTEIINGEEKLYKILDSGISTGAGWYVQIIHWPERISKEDKGGGQGFAGDNSLAYTTRYLHLRDPPLVVPGQKVKRGQIIGFVGGTPWFSPHLHIDVVYKGVYVDPGPYCYLDINAIAMIEDEGNGTIRNNDSTPGVSGWCRKVVKSNKGKDLKINYRVGTFITGQQYISPKVERNPYSKPGRPSINRRWYKPVIGNPLTEAELTYVVNQPKVSETSTENPTATDAGNEKQADISKAPQASAPPTAKS